MEAEFVRPVSYPHDVDAGLQTVVLLQADLLFVLDDCAGHGDDDDGLTLRGLDVERTVFRIDLHAFYLFHAGGVVFFLFCAFGFDVDVGPDVTDGVFARLDAFFQYFPRTVVAALIIDLEVVEGIVG